MVRQPTPHTLALPRLFLWSACSLLLLLLWDFSGLDLQLAQWFGSARGFPLESHWLWRGVLHDGIRYLPWLLELALLLAMARPFGAIKQLPVERRVQLALTTLVALLVVSSIKLHSSTSCPWDLQQFGGAATYLSHWAWGVADGGGGGCFPAGHASAGFAFVGGFFAFRHALPATARRWLIGALAVGLLLGLAQQVRGAHYMSHTLWTAWLCWACAALVDMGVSQLLSQKPARAQAPVPALSKLRPSLQAE
jgi:membrane-associated PAP2 superfamily phosphatase